MHVRGAQYLRTHRAQRTRKKHLRNQRPPARRALRSWAAQHKTSVRRTSRKRPRPSRAPQEVTRDRPCDVHRPDVSACGGTSGYEGARVAGGRTWTRCAWGLDAGVYGSRAACVRDAPQLCLLRGTAKGAWALQRRTLNLMGGELSPATRRRTRGAQRGSAIWIGENETSPAVPAVRIKLLARS